MKKVFLLLLGALISGATIAQMDDSYLDRSFKADAESVDAKVIEWRRYIHQNPELSNREFKTGEYIAAYMKELGLEVKTGVAHTGVVAILRGGKPGPVIGLRADIDALPVRERADLPFKSQAKGTYKGQEVDVMHACGHDTHVAMLMGAATILTKMKAELSGTIKFVFQPAEEGAPEGEEGGAGLMVKEGVLKNPDVDVMFGLHINSMTEVGTMRFKPGGAMAAADIFNIKIKGKLRKGKQVVHTINLTGEESDVNSLVKQIMREVFEHLKE